MAKQFGNCWLSRDKRGAFGNVYSLTKARPKLIPNDNRTVKEWDSDVDIDSDIFHKLTPTRLKPGEGPMRAQITIEI